MKPVFIILLALLSIQGVAQQGLQMDFGEIDSTEIQQQRRYEYHQLINGELLQNDLLVELQLPVFNIEQEYRNRYTVSLDMHPQYNYTGVSVFNYEGVSPFLYNAEMLSSAAYKLGDKFVLGGFSYGSNSIFSAPAPNQNTSYFDTYGSTMFVKYKVSKNISIETSINVNQRRGGPGF